MKPRAVRKTKPARQAPRRDTPPPLLHHVVQALDAKKAEDIRVLDVSRLSSITDHLVLATGTSEPHLRALRIEVERVFAEKEAKVLGVDTTKGSGWTIIDGIVVMVHLFLPDMRAKYRLEILWKDAQPGDVR